MQITQLWKYTTTLRRAVSLPGDREEDRERERSIGDQLNNIISHIEVKYICKYKIAQNTQIFNTKEKTSSTTSYHISR